MMRRAVRARLSLGQRRTIVTGMLLFVALINILQIWLLTATLNAWLGGDSSPVLPAAGVTLVCLLLNAGLLRYLYGLER